MWEKKPNPPVLSCSCFSIAKQRGAFLKTEALHYFRASLVGENLTDTKSVMSVILLRRILFGVVGSELIF